MKSMYISTARREGLTVRYYLLTGNRSMYGILVEKGSERTVLPDLSPSMGKVRDLLERMFRGFVTPVSARDVAEDWLLE